MKVLFATDGSRHAEYAERFLISLFPPGVTDLSVVTVCPASSLQSIDFEFPVDVQEAVSGCLDQAKQLANNVQARLNYWAKSIGTAVLEGHAAHEIIKEIESSKPELCVVGSHGRSAIDRFLMGSVSDSVTKHAHSSILLARPTNENFAHTKCERIVIADDGSEQSRAAVERFAGMETLQGAEFHIVSIVPEYSATGFVPVLDVPKLTEEAIQIHKRRHSEYTDRLSNLAESITTTVLIAQNIPHEIVKIADDKNADLIVVGGKQKTALNRVLLGSVSLSVLHHAHCSVWIER